MKNKEISVGLSIFIIIASFIGILSIVNSEGGISGFVLLETAKIGNIGAGLALFLILLTALSLALVNIAYQERIIK